MHPKSTILAPKATKRGGLVLGLLKPTATNFHISYREFCNSNRVASQNSCNQPWQRHECVVMMMMIETATTTTASPEVTILRLKSMLVHIGYSCLLLHVANLHMFINVSNCFERNATPTSYKIIWFITFCSGAMQCKYPQLTRKVLHVSLAWWLHNLFHYLLPPRQMVLFMCGNLSFHLLWMVSYSLDLFDYLMLNRRDVHNI